MTLKVRRFISLIFITLFLTVTPAIMLYAAGYKLSLNGFAIQRTGMFIIDSEPAGAKIFLDGRPQTGWLGSIFPGQNFITTPAKINNLLPGEYTISVELSGYFSWQKKLIISPGASTFAENIHLFKNQPPLEVKPAGAVSFSPDKTRTLILSADNASIYNLADGSEKILNLKGLKGKAAAWSGQNDKITIDGLLFDLSAGEPAKPLNLGKLAPGVYDYKWAGQILYGRDKNSLYRLETDNSFKKIANGSAFTDYLIKDNRFYLTKSAATSTELEILNISSGRRLKIINLPVAANLFFINPENSLLNLYDQGRQTLYLINPDAANSPPLIDAIAGVKTARWTGGQLLYANDFEIWLYRPELKQKTLITRISEIINDAVLLPNKNYIFFSTPESIKTIELDDRDKRIIGQLVKTDKIGVFSLDAEGATAYFSGKNGGFTGLFKYSLE